VDETWAEWTEPTAVNKKGTRCVVETNWDRVGGPRCQMIWERTPDGGCVVTTCRQDMPPIALTAAQCGVIAQFLGPEPR
jgi:hypothetical protein